MATSDEVEAAHVMAPPYVVKPNNEGSSVGVYIVGEGANGPPQLADEMPATVMVETYAPGRELTTTVMGDRALTVTDIITDGWYDYHAKYAEADRATRFRPISPQRFLTPAWTMRCAPMTRWAVAGVTPH